jgi:hypothetical protein
MTRPLYQVLACTLEAAFNCERTGNEEWFGKHSLRLEVLVKKFMPSGSGFDAGTALKFDNQKTGQLRFTTSFHHMNDQGMYHKWTTHEVVITPNLAHGFDIKVTGANYNEVKAYLVDVFNHALMTEIKNEELTNAV